MPAGSDYLPVATGAGANVDSQANFAGSAYQQYGFQIGIANPSQANKIWRQASMVAAAVTNFVANQLGIYISDDGNIANLITHLTSAIISAAAGANEPEAIVVPYSATPNFDCGAGLNTIVLVFEITLTGDAAPTITGLKAGQLIRFIITQDGAGGHAWTWPANVYNAGSIDSAPSATSIASFVVGAGLGVHAEGGIAG